MATTRRSARKPLVSSILLWMRDRSAPSARHGLLEGPALEDHLRDSGDGGVPPDPPGGEQSRAVAGHRRRRDGHPGRAPDRRGRRVTFTSVLSPLRGRKQTRLAYKDEVNVFRRTLLYAGPPNSARWYDVAGPGEKVGARSLIYLRRREGVTTGAFRTFVKDELVPALVKTGALRELRTQVFMPWIETALGHAERRTRQPHRSTVPRLADPRLRRCRCPPGLLR